MGRVQAPGRVDQHQLPLRRGRAALPLRQRRSRRRSSTSGSSRHASAAMLADAARPAPRDRRSTTAAPSRRPAPRTRPLRGGDGVRLDPSATSPPARRDDLYILYTGGTTGMPKGVMWRHEDVFYALGGGIDPLTGTRVARPQQMVEKGRGRRPAHLPPHRAPHARRHAVVGDGQSFVGHRDRARGQVRPPRGLGPRRAGSGSTRSWSPATPWASHWSRRWTSPASDLRPLVAARRGLDGGAVLAAGQGRVLRALPEPGHDRRHRLVGDRQQRDDHGHAGQHRDEERRRRCRRSATPSCSTRSSSPCSPDPASIGKIARARRHPHRLLQRPGQDGRGVRHGRRASATSCPATSPRSRPTGRSPCSAGARSASTPAARRSSPRRSSPRSAPTPTCSTPSSSARPTSAGARRVAAIVEPRAGHSSPTLESSRSTAASTIAGYKVPRQLHVVDKIERSPSGKPDYPWAKEIVKSSDASASPSGASSAGVAG